MKKTVEMQANNDYFGFLEGRATSRLLCISTNNDNHGENERIVSQDSLYIQKYSILK